MSSSRRRVRRSSGISSTSTAGRSASAGASSLSGAGNGDDVARRRRGGALRRGGRQHGVDVRRRPAAAATAVDRRLAHRSGHRDLGEIERDRLGRRGRPRPAAGPLARSRQREVEVAAIDAGRRASAAGRRAKSSVGREQRDVERVGRRCGRRGEVEQRRPGVRRRRPLSRRDEHQPGGLRQELPRVGHGQHRRERVDRRADQRARVRVGRLAEQALEQSLEARGRASRIAIELHRAGDAGKGVRGALEVFGDRLAFGELRLPRGERTRDGCASPRERSRRAIGESWHAADVRSSPSSAASAGADRSDSGADASAGCELDRRRGPPPTRLGCGSAGAVGAVMVSVVGERDRRGSISGSGVAAGVRRGGCGAQRARRGRRRSPAVTSPSGSPGLHLLRDRDDLRLVGARAAGLQARDRTLEELARGGDQREEIGRRRALFLEPAVHDLLDRPRGLAEAREADHAAAALQRVEAAPDRAQHLDVLRHLARLLEALRDRAEHLAGLFEVDGRAAPRRSSRRSPP